MAGDCRGCARRKSRANGADDGRDLQIFFEMGVLYHAINRSRWCTPSAARFDKDRISGRAVQMALTKSVTDTSCFLGSSILDCDARVCHRLQTTNRSDKGSTPNVSPFCCTLAVKTRSEPAIHPRLPLVGDVPQMSREIDSLTEHTFKYYQDSTKEKKNRPLIPRSRFTARMASRTAVHVFAQRAKRLYAGSRILSRRAAALGM